MRSTLLAVLVRESKPDVRRRPVELDRGVSRQSRRNTRTMLRPCSFGDAVVSLDAARPIGVIGADGELRLNPPAAGSLGAGDQLVTIAADAGDVVVGKRRIPPVPAEPLQLAIASSAMRLLFIGWNSIAPALLVEFDRLAAAGSTALVWFDDTVLTAADIVIPQTRNLDVNVLPGSDPTCRCVTGASRWRWCWPMNRCLP